MFDENNSVTSNSLPAVGRRLSATEADAKKRDVDSKQYDSASDSPSGQSSPVGTEPKFEELPIEAKILQLKMHLDNIQSTLAHLFEQIEYNRSFNFKLSEKFRSHVHPNVGQGPFNPA